MNTYDKFKTKEGNILVIGDTHLPAEHPGYLGFVKRVRDLYSCTRVVHIGDFVDHHSSSFHESDPDLHSAGDELCFVKQKASRWYSVFPEVLVCWGNHDAIPARKLKASGLPSSLLRTPNEIYGAPRGWVWGDSFILDGVLFKHQPEGGNTLTGQLRGAERNMMSTVTGHCHSTAGVAYSAGYKDTVFAMATGCGVDRNHQAMAYGKNSRFKPVIGCGVVFTGGKRAVFVPMDLQAYNNKKKQDI